MRSTLESGAEAAGDVGGALLAGQVAGVGLAPARGKAPAMPIACSDLGVAPAGLREGCCAARHAAGASLVGARVSRSVSSVRPTSTSAPTAQRSPIQRMEQEADGEVERHPRQVEQRGRAGPERIAAHLVEVAQRLQAVAACARLQRQRATSVVDPRAQNALVERAADAHQDAPAQDVEDCPGRQIEAADQHGEADSVGTLRLGSTRS